MTWKIQFQFWVRKRDFLTQQFLPVFNLKLPLWLLFEICDLNFFWLFSDVNGKKTAFVDCDQLYKFIQPPTSILSLKGGYPMVSYTVMQIQTISKESETVSERLLYNLSRTSFIKNQPCPMSILSLDLLSQRFYRTS